MASIPANSKPCCICGELNQNRVMLPEHRYRLGRADPGFIVRKSSQKGTSFHLPPITVLKDGKKILIWCQRCRKQSLGKVKNLTPVQKQQFKRRLQDIASSNHVSKKRHAFISTQDRPVLRPENGTGSTEPVQVTNDIETIPDALEKHLSWIKEFTSGGTGGFLWMNECYESYRQECSSWGQTVLSSRTFARKVEGMAFMALTNSHTKRGTLISSKDALSSLIMRSLPAQTGLNGRERRSLLKNQSNVYRVRKDFENVVDTIDAASVDLIVHSLSRIDPELFRSEMMDVEPENQRKRRRAAEAEVGGDVQKLSVPFGAGLPLGPESLRRLTVHEFRGVVRVVSLIQMKVFIYDPRCCGDVLWGFGTALHLKGNRRLVNFANHIGISPCYTVLEADKKRIFHANTERSSAEKLDKDTLKVFAWDNIDVSKTYNALRTLEGTRDFHGTVLMSQETKGFAAVKGEKIYTSITKERYPKPSDMLKSERVYNPARIRDAQTLICGLVFFFKDNLMSPDESTSVSLDFLLKNTLVFQKLESQMPSICENLELLSSPSNSRETSEKILRSVLSISDDSGGSLSVLTGDNPLYLRMIDVIYESFGGKRANEFSNITPQLGLMHVSMALFDLVKYIAFDSVMDGLMKDSGFSKKSQENFRNVKDFKSNLRFFQQATSALLIRMIDELIEEGIGFEGETSLVHPTTGQCATLSQKLNELRDWSFPGVCSGLDFDLNVRHEFFPLTLIQVGRKIAENLNQKSKSLSPNEAFYASVVMNLLVPCLAFHYFARSGLLAQRNSMFTSLIPYVYCTGKLKYQEALLYDLREKITMPDSVHNALFDRLGTCCSITGNTQSYQHNDEALESSCIKLTKEGASQGTENSIRTSFFTVNKRSQLVSNAMASVSRPPGFSRDSQTKKDDRIVFVDDKARATANCVRRMYSRLSGNLDGSSEYAFYSVRHRSVPVLINPLSDACLALSESDTEKCLNMLEYGRRTMDKHGYVILNPWLERTMRKKPWTTKYKLHGFARQRDKIRSDTKAARQLREKKYRQDNFRTTIARRGLSLAIAQETGQAQLSKRIKAHMDLVSPMPHAFMQSGDNTPRHTAKSETMKLFQDVWKLGAEVNEPLFLVPGYPNIREEKIAVAVDAMNFIHHDVDKTYSLTIRLHLEQLASKVLNAIPYAVRHKVAVLDVHFDDISRVTPFKGEEHARRDDARGAERNLGRASENFSLVASIDPPGFNYWRKNVLGNRKQKNILMNAVAASIVLRACMAQDLYPVRIFGASFSVSKQILDASILPNSACLQILGDGEPAILLNSEKETGIHSSDLRKFFPQNCLKVESFAPVVDDEIEDFTSTQLGPVFITVNEDVTAESFVGEGEIRMQYQLHRFAESLPPDYPSITALQISADSDNIALALMALSKGKYSRYERVIVKLPSRYADINQLRRCLVKVSVGVLTFVMLYCLCGNDFCCGCSVASPNAILKAYKKFRGIIGNLAVEESCTKLYYAFLHRRGLADQLLEMNVPPDKWNIEARKAIAFHQHTRSTDHLLPQDEDLTLQYCRATWNVYEYWSQCTSKNVQFIWPDPEQWGFQTSGRMLLYKETSLQARNTILRSLQLPSCSCGKNTKSDLCCDPKVNTGCTCVKNGTACTYRCKCARYKCYHRKCLVVHNTFGLDSARKHNRTAIQALLDGE